MFASHKKLYFVFADEEDMFFTDSMLRLHTTDYLWLMLRKSGYSNVFFIKDTQNGLTLEIPDRDTARNYSRLQKLFRKHDQDIPTAIPIDVDKLSRWIIRSKKKDGDGPTAWVFRCTAFQRCLGNGVGTLFAFIEWQKHCTDTVILLLPMCLSEREMMLFTSPKSVFSWMDNQGACLSRPVYDLIHSSEPIPIFERLSTELGSAMIQLGVFSYRRICTMLRWAALRMELDMSAETFWDYANFLYWYVYSPSLRAYIKEPLAHYSNCRELAECLLQHGTFDVIDERIDVLKQQFPGERLADILYRICPLRKDEDRTWIQITHDNQQLLRLAQMPFPADFTQIGRNQDATAYDFHRWLEMQRWVVKPNSQAVRKEHMDCIFEFMETYRTSLLADDEKTSLRAARALYEIALSLHGPMVSQERLEAYRVYLQLSQVSYRLHNQILGMVHHMTDSQQQDAMRKNPTLVTAVNILLNYQQMLEKMGDAFLLPDFRLGSLQRDALALMKKLETDETSPLEFRTLTEEEKERVYIKFDNMG